jgi:hypothetical protein
VGLPEASAGALPSHNSGSTVVNGLLQCSYRSVLIKVAPLSQDEGKDGDAGPPSTGYIPRAALNHG